MKKLLTIIKLLSLLSILLLSIILLVACEDKKPVEPILPEPSTPLVPLEPSTPIEKPEDDEAVIVLDTELRTQNQSYTVTYKDLTNYEELVLTLTMTGTYDNPITIKSMNINNEPITLTVEGLPTAAGEHASGLYELAGHKVEFNRGTNYQPLRIKSTSTETGFMALDLTNINSLDIELVFTTTAAKYFKEVILKLN